MILFLRLIRALFGLIAGQIFIHYLLVLVSRISSMMEDEKFELVPMLPISVVCFLAFILIRILIHYLHKKKYGVLHPKLRNLWHL